MPEVTHPNLPLNFKWLAEEKGHPLLLQMLALYGVAERPGDADNPIILEWARELGNAAYKHDSVPWCGLGMAVAAKRAGERVPDGYLYALNWHSFGSPVAAAMLGDVLVFKRYNAGHLIGGHVGLYVGETGSARVLVLGANQGDRVSIVSKTRDTLHAIRRPLNLTGANLRRVTISEGVPVNHSTNEQ